MKFRIFLRRLFSSKSEFQAWKTHRLEELTNQQNKLDDEALNLMEAHQWCKLQKRNHVCQIHLENIKITLEAIKKEALNLRIQAELIKKEQLHLLLLP